MEAENSSLKFFRDELSVRAEDKYKQISQEVAGADKKNSSGNYL